MHEILLLDGVHVDVQEEAAMLRRALNESMRRVASLSDEGNAQVDRRIVVKLLVTFFERGQSQEVLSLMARILAFSGQTKHCLIVMFDMCNCALAPPFGGEICVSQ